VFFLFPFFFFFFFSQLLIRSVSRFWIARIGSSIAAVSRRHGVFEAVCVVMVLVVTFLASLAISCFCIEGCVRSVIEIHEGNEERPGIVGIRPLGDFGGWFSIAIFSLLTIKAVVDALLREGEYLLAIELIREWCREHKRQNCRQCLDEATTLLSLINSRCGPLRRTAAQVHVDGYRAVFLPDAFEKDPEVSSVLALADDLSRHLSVFRIPRRWLTGALVLVRSGVCGNIVWIFFGVVIPFCLVVNAVLSTLGCVGLGVELFVLRHELTDVGHFGEWMFNSVESFSAAIILGFLFIINEGDLVYTRTVYQNHFRKDSPIISSLARTDLSNFLPICSFWKTPEDVAIEEL
jgi:hypothetical protein